ncbi:unnamed protein product, partial [marine sediment metagenome]
YDNKPDRKHGQKHYLDYVAFYVFSTIYNKL